MSPGPFDDDWLDRHRVSLKELFTVLGADDGWSDDDETILRFMEHTWLGHEHGTQDGKPEFSDHQQAEAMGLLRSMGFVDRVNPSQKHYDEILLLGASGIGLHRRLELVRTSGVTAQKLTVLAGLRPHERNDRDGSLSALLAADGRFAAAPGWEPQPELQMRADLLGDVGLLDDQQSDWLAAAALVPHETALAELLVDKQWPGLRPVDTRHGPPHPATNELGQRRWSSRTYSCAGPFETVRLVNGAPVDRGDGRLRPTTESTVDEWLKLNDGTPGPADVLVVVNQPHLARTRLRLLKIIGEGSGNGTRLDFAGCEANLATSGVVLILGEIPARIRADRTQIG